MAVYTDITDAELEAFLGDYDVGTPLAFKGIAEGVENSNFMLETTAGRFILTVYERRVKAEDLPFFLGLMQWLAAQGYPSAAPRIKTAKAPEYAPRAPNRPKIQAVASMVAVMAAKNAVDSH